LPQADYVEGRSWTLLHSHLTTLTRRAASRRLDTLAVNELHASHDLSDQAWAALTAATGEDAALDLALLCGWYHAISYAVRALRLDLERGTAPIPR